MALLDLIDDGTVLGSFGFVHDIGVIQTRNRTVGWNFDNVKVIDRAEFLFLRQRCTGHAGELAVKAEVVLEGNGGKRLAFAGDLHAFLGFNGLMQTVRVAAAEHQTARVFIIDDDLAVLEDVVNIALHRAVCFECLIDMMCDGGVFGIRQVFKTEELLDLFDAALCQRSGLCLFINDVVSLFVDVFFFLFIGLGDDLLAEGAHERFGLGVHFRGLFADTGDDERGTRFIDEDGVHLVDDGKGVSALDKLRAVNRHIVAQIIKAHLVVGAVGDVSGIGAAALLTGKIVHDQTDGETEEAVHLAHPFAVSLGEVVVDGDDVNALTGKTVEVGRQRSDQRFAFTGFHFGNAALMQHDAADELHAVGTQAQHTVSCFAYGGKGLGQNIVERFAVGKTLFEFGRLGLKLRVTQCLVFLLQRFDLIRNGVDALELTLRVSTENFRKKTHYSDSFHGA